MTLCGEVYLTKNTSILFICTFCNENYGDPIDFVKHLQFKHIPDPITKEEITETTFQHDGKKFEYLSQAPAETNESCQLSDIFPDIIQMIESLDDSGDEDSLYDQDYTKEEFRVEDTNSDQTVSNICENAEFELVGDEAKPRTSYTEPEAINLQEIDDPGENMCSSTSWNLEAQPTFRNTNGKKVTKCPLCPTFFRDLKGHMERAHKGGIFDCFKCEICSKIFKTKFKRDEHLKIHRNQRNFKCEICGFTFVQKENLKTHMRRHNGVKLHPCKLCNKSFVTGPELRSHTRTHTGEKPFICDTCGKSFVTSGSLTTHRKSSHRHVTRQFQCTICDKAFLTHKYLKDHIETHKMKRTHICPICHATFRLRGYLRSHMRNHEELKPHQCKLCNKGFIKYSVLKGHMRAVHDVMFSCEKIPLDQSSPSQQEGHF